MWRLTAIFLQLLSIIIGLLAMYLGAFLYTKKRARIRNTLEDSWTRIKKETDVSLRRAFLGEVSSIAWVGLCSVVGFKPIFPLRFMPSKKAIEKAPLATFLSWAYVSAIACLLMRFVVVVPSRANWDKLGSLVGYFEEHAVVILVVGILLIFLRFFTGRTFSDLFVDRLLDARQVLSNLRSWRRDPKAELVSDRLRRRSLLRKLRQIRTEWSELVKLFVPWFVLPFVLVFALFGLGCLLVVLSYAVLVNFPPLIRPSYGWLIILSLGSMIINLCFFAAFYRLWLTWIGSKSFGEIMLTALAMCALASICFFGPLLFVNDGWALRPPSLEQTASPTTISCVARYLAYFSTVNLAAAYSFFAIASVLLVHRAIWSHMKRPLIAIALSGISLNRDRLYCIGIVFLFLATGKYGWVKELIDNPGLIDRIAKVILRFAEWAL